MVMEKNQERLVHYEVLLHGNDVTIKDGNNFCYCYRDGSVHLECGYPVGSPKYKRVLISCNMIVNSIDIISKISK